MKRALLAGLVLAAACSAAAASAPDPIAQPPLDGCAREGAVIDQGLAPAWVYVNAWNGGASPPQSVTGVVDGGAQPFLGSHPSVTDHDFDIDVKADAAFSFLLGGSAVARTGNFAGGGDGAGRLRAVRESSAFPTFAWPDPGDRVQVLGSWVWDCSRWKPAGERTELHPFRALWVQRGVSARSPWGEQEGDLFVSTDSTQAGAIADCALTARGDSAVFGACLPAQPHWQDVSGDYRFVLPAPPKPPGAGTLRVRVVDRGSIGTAAPTVTLRNGAAVVTMKLASASGVRLVVAKQVFVGWTKVPATELPQHLRLSFRNLLVLKSLDSAAWNLYWDAAGVWGAWSPRLLDPSDGESFAARQTVDVYLPRGKAWRLLVFARTTAGGAPGIVVHRFASPVVSLGLHRDGPIRQATSCPRSNAHGCYELTYVVTRVNDAVKRAASQPR